MRSALNRPTCCIVHHLALRANADMQPCWWWRLLPLLPSRDLLSSQWQLPGHTHGVCKRLGATFISRLFFQLSAGVPSWPLRFSLCFSYFQLEFSRKLGTRLTITITSPSQTAGPLAEMDRLLNDWLFFLNNRELVIIFANNWPLSAMATKYQRRSGT